MQAHAILLVVASLVLGAALVPAQQPKDARVPEARLLKSQRGFLTPRSMAFSPDGRFLATTTSLGAPGVNEEGMIMFDLKTGLILYQHTSEKRLGPIAFSPDGKFVACGEGDPIGGEQGQDKRCAILLVDTPTGKERLRIDGHENSVLTLAFTRDGQGIVSGSMDGTMRLWSTTTGEEIERPVDLKPDPRFGEEGPRIGRVQALAFSPDGKVLAYERTGKIHFLDWRDRPKQTTIEYDPKPGGFVFSPDGKLLAVNAARVAILDMQTHKERFGFPERRHAAISHDSRWLATENPKDACIEVFDLTTGKEVLWLQAAVKRTSRFTGRVGAVSGASGPLAFSPTSKHLAACSGGAIVVWDLNE